MKQPLFSLDAKIHVLWHNEFILNDALKEV